MAFVDDLNRILRDHVGYSGDGQGGVGSLPVGDQSTPRNQISLRDLREILILIAQTLGDPSALQVLIDQLDGKAPKDAIKLFALTNVGGSGDAVTAEKPSSQSDITIFDGSLVALQWPATNALLNPTVTINDTQFATRRKNGLSIQPEELVGGSYYLFIKHSASALRLVGSSGISDIFGLIEALADLTAAIGEEESARVALRNASAITLTNVGGTPNAITANLPADLGLTTVPVGMPLSLRGVGVNDGPVDLTIPGAPPNLPALDGQGRELQGGELSSSTPLIVRLSGSSPGTEYRIMSSLVHPADLADVANEVEAANAARELGQVLRLNNVEGVNQITASIASAQMPAELVNDAKLILVPAADNTSNDVDGDFGFGPHPFRDPEGGVLFPGDLKTGAPSLLRFSTFGGGQWRMVGGVARSRPAVVVQRSTAAIDIYLHQTGDNYVHVQVTRVPRPERNSDVWRIDRCRHVRASSRTSYTHVADITTQGSEIEQVIYLIGADDGIGGYIHGNEEFTDFSVSLDGTPLTVNGWYSGREIVLTQTSNGFLPGATNETKWEPKGPHVLTNVRTWRISTYPATIDIANEVTQHAAGHVVYRGYAGMLPMLAANADLASHWPYTVQMPVVPGSNILSDAQRMLIWGSSYWGNVQVIEGWDAPDREMRVKLDSAPVGKVYPDAWRGLVSAVDGVWRARTVLQFGLIGDQGIGRGSPATAGDIAAARGDIDVLNAVANDLQEQIEAPFDAPLGYSLELGNVNWTTFDSNPEAGEQGHPLAGWADDGLVAKMALWTVLNILGKTSLLPDYDLSIDVVDGLVDGEAVVGFLPDRDRNSLILYRKGTGGKKPGLDMIMSEVFWDRARDSLNLSRLSATEIQIISESNQSLGTGGPFVAGATRSDLLGRVDPAAALMLGGMEGLDGTPAYTNGVSNQLYDQTVPATGLVRAEPRATHISGSWPLAAATNSHREDLGLPQVPILTTTHGYGGMLIEDMDDDASDGTGSTVVWDNLDWWYDEAIRVAADAGKTLTVPWHDWLHGTSAKDYPQGQYYGLLIAFQSKLRALLSSKGLAGPATFIMSQPGGDVNTVGETWWVCDEILDFCEAGAGVLATPEYAYEIADNSVHPDAHATAQMQEVKALAIAHVEAGYRWTIGRPKWSVAGNIVTLDFADIWDGEYLVAHDPDRYGGEGIDAFAGFQVDGASITGMQILGRRVTLTCSAPPTGLRYALQQQNANGLAGNRWTAHRGLMRTSSAWPSKLIPGSSLYRWLPSFRISF